MNKNFMILTVRDRERERVKALSTTTMKIIKRIYLKQQQLEKCIRKLIEKQSIIAIKISQLTHTRIHLHLYHK